MKIVFQVNLGKIYPQKIRMIFQEYLGQIFSRNLRIIFEDNLGKISGGLQRRELISYAEAPARPGISFWLSADDEDYDYDDDDDDEEEDGNYVGDDDDAH